MLPLPMPADEALATYRLCISRVGKRAAKSRLLGLENDVATAADLYIGPACAEALHTLGSQQFTPGSAEDVTELKKSYEDRMAMPRAAGRPVYDRLKSAASGARYAGTGT